jgi:Na+/alanine symporter
MKPKIKNYEILMALMIIVNVLVFMFFSRHMEKLIKNYTVQVESKDGL